MRRPQLKSAVAGLLTAMCLVGASSDSSGQRVPTHVVPAHVVPRTWCPREGPTHVVPAPLGGAAGRGRGHPGKLTGADLVSYTSCAQMLRQVKAEALEEVGQRPPGCQRRCPGCAGPTVAPAAASSSGVRRPRRPPLRRPPRGNWATQRLMTRKRVSTSPIWSRPTVR